jgi:hypothetical protein
MRKSMSLKQLDANRRNAQKSTGPKIPNGQAVSKMNAGLQGTCFHAHIKDRYSCRQIA